MALERVRFDIGEYELIPLEEADPTAIADFHMRNKERFAPYSPLRSKFYFTKSHWKKACTRSRRERKAETALRWVLVLKEDVIGQVSLDQIFKGVRQSGSLSYLLDEAHEGRGLMTQSLDRVLKFAFETLNLHRVTANHIPENEKSASVLERLGFEKEGYAKSFLKLNGQWKDHVLNARINPDHIE